jgi:hypothetical protein
MANSKKKSSSGAPKFDEPVDDNAAEQEATGASSDFLVPPGEDDAGGGSDDSFDADQDAAASFGTNNDLLQLKADLERQIFARDDAQTSASSDGPDSSSMIMGVGIGAAHRDFESVGANGPGAPVLNVYVSEPMNMDEVKELLVDDYGAHVVSDDAQKVNVIVSGVIDAQAHRHRQRPAPCGISSGHFRITAGTLGALARGRSGVRVNRLLALSNNHVFANSNIASIGDNILQPGPADGGVNPADRIALLERWVPINFSATGVNYVDAATGWCWPDRVRRDFIYRSGASWAYFRVGSIPVAPVLGMIVGKSGRTTQLRTGRIIDTSASIRVNYGGGRIANFRDQIAIRGLNGDFSAGGDSGSLIWTWDARRAPVGLLYAGGGGVTFGNKIGRVLSALDINLYT